VDTCSGTWLEAHAVMVEASSAEHQYPIIAGSIPLHNQVIRGSEWGLSTPRGEKAAIEAIRELLDGGADVNEADPVGVTALHLACRHGEDGIARFLIERGADVHAKTNELKIPILLRGCGHTDGHTECCRAVLDHGADVNEPDGNGFTPIMHAVMANNVELVKLLLRRGADRNATVTCGLVKNEGAFDFAKTRGHEQVAKALRLTPSPAA